jgi:hypothetical protein
VAFDDGTEINTSSTQPGGPLGRSEDVRRIEGTLAESAAGRSLPELSGEGSAHQRTAPRGELSPGSCARPRAERFKTRPPFPPRSGERGRGIGGKPPGGDDTRVSLRHAPRSRPASDRRQGDLEHPDRMQAERRTPPLSNVRRWRAADAASVHRHSPSGSGEVSTAPRTVTASRAPIPKTSAEERNRAKRSVRTGLRAL